QVNTFLQPTSIIDNVTETLLVRCTLEGNSDDTLTAQSLTLSFNKPSSVGPKQHASVARNGAPQLSTDISNRATVEGSINTDSVTASFLNLRFNNVSCADVGTYTCKFTYQNDTIMMMMETPGNVSGTSRPGRIEVRHEPVKPKYMVGEDVTLHCQAKVSKPAGEWSWQRLEGEVWKPYTNGVSQDAPALVTDCAYFRTTSLVYRIATEEETKFRCIINNDISYSMETSINGEVNGGHPLIISPVLVMLAILSATWR
ncbi:uncharacterized protein LOC124113959, partial [Haliotis rufescens]|uniref:uncharacterized protein LOC124113959 n=1 Tax=Haliotis rufescens TaxID=6454 RepID=UPI00201EC024